MKDTYHTPCECSWLGGIIPSDYHVHLCKCECMHTKTQYTRVRLFVYVEKWNLASEQGILRGTRVSTRQYYLYLWCNENYRRRWIWALRHASSNATCTGRCPSVRNRPIHWSEHDLIWHNIFNHNCRRQNYCELLFTLFSGAQQFDNAKSAVGLEVDQYWFCLSRHW